MDDFVFRNPSSPAIKNRFGMENLISNPSSPASPAIKNHFTSVASSHFSLSDNSYSVNGARRTPRHHSLGAEKSPSLRTYNEAPQAEHLMDRILNYEKEVGKLYQMIQKSQQRAKNPPTFNHTRSASISHQYSPSPSPAPESYQVNGYGTEFEEVFNSNSVPQVTIAELQTSIERLLSEQDTLVSQVDDWKQITEAAKRERVLAIDEKDQLLRETHSLRVAVDSAQSLLGKMESERETLRRQVRDLKEDLVSLKRDNEKAREMQSLALEEKSKMRIEYSELQHELHAYQTERDELYKKTLLQQALIDEVLGEKQRLEHDLSWLSSKNGAEGFALQEEVAITQSPGKAPIGDSLEVTLNRSTLGMPWGFTFEGGKGTEFYHQDPSIVITGVANRTPASDVLRFGDRVILFDGHNFHNVTKKEAAETIRSCDHTTVSVTVTRAPANVKPDPQEVKIPGKKDFGFSCETRLFVTSSEEASSSAGLLFPGDEIIQIQGKSAFNMKPSTLKQLLKSCKDGVTLTVQRQPGLNLTSMVSGKTRQTGSTNRLKRDSRETTSTGSLLPLNGARSVQSHRLSSDFVQSPGTPKSNISESSAGYHSLAHSIPSSEVSSAGPDSKTGQAGPDSDVGFQNGAVLEKRPICKRLSDGDVHPTHHRPDSASGASSNGISRSSYRTRPADYYPPRRNTSTSTYQGRPGQGHKTRSYSMSTYKSAPTVNPDSSNRAEHYLGHVRVATPHSPNKIPVATASPNVNKPFSMSADNLDSEPVMESKRSTSHSESQHDKPHPQEAAAGRMALPNGRSRGHLSVSTSNMQTHV